MLHSFVGRFLGKPVIAVYQLELDSLPQFVFKEPLWIIRRETFYKPGNLHATQTSVKAVKETQSTNPNQQET